MSFQASYPGRCGCGEPISPGDEVFYDGEILYREECCGIPEVLTRTERPASRVELLDKVMPRGATAADRCDRCFQIPSANGVCGCN